MRARDDQAAVMRRIKRIEDTADARVRRALEQCIHSLQREFTEYTIRQRRRERVASPASPPQETPE